MHQVRRTLSISSMGYASSEKSYIKLEFIVSVSNQPNWLFIFLFNNNYDYEINIRDAEMCRRRW